MRKLLLLALILVVSLTSCVTRTVPAKQVTCHIPPAPPKPELHPEVCGELVCLPIPEVVALADYARLNDEREWAIKGCPAVEVR